jgi:hypothetical protein
MKDYRLILTYNGEDNKKDIKGNFYPHNGDWVIEDYEKAIELLKFGEDWYRECIAREKKKNSQIKKEINDILLNAEAGIKS